jgi:DNA repair protein RadC
VTEAQVTELQQLYEVLHQTCKRIQEVNDPPKITTPSDVFPHMSHLIKLKHEELWIVILNSKNDILEIHQLYKGAVNNSQVRIAEVFRQAIILNALAIIIVHNHPSSDLTPSPDDVVVTHAIVKAGKLLNIDVLDHIIVGQSGFCSLREKRLGFA